MKLRSVKRIFLILLACQVALTLLVTAATALSQGQPSRFSSRDLNVQIIDLGPIGNVQEPATDLNNRGQAVGTISAEGQGESQAFLWEDDQTVLLDAPGSLGSAARGINEIEHVVGAIITASGDTTGTLPILWHDGTSTLLETGENQVGVAEDINDAEEIVGGLVYSNSAGTYGNSVLHVPSLWQNGNHAALDTGGDFDGWARAINSMGQIVGWTSNVTGNHQATLWDAGNRIPLVTLPDSSSDALDVNDHGQIVGWSTLGQDLNAQAVLWEDGSLQNLATLGDPATSESRANAINDGGVIVGESEFDGELRAVIWQDDTLSDLNEWLPPGSGWERLVSASSINEEGWIAGTGLIEGGLHTFLLIPRDYLTYLPVAFKEPWMPPYDMATFMIGDGRLYEVQHSSGSQARHQTQVDSPRFYHTKGDEISAEWEELWIQGNTVKRGTDTSPGNGLFYTLSENGTTGSAWSPRFWSVGDLFERNPLVTFYRKVDCSVVASGFQNSWLLFEAFHNTYAFQSGIVLHNVVQLAWLLEPSAEPIERYFYAEDYGLVGWASAENGFSYISEVHEPGQRPNNTREEIPCLNQLPDPGNREPLGPLPPPYRAK